MINMKLVKNLTLSAALATGMLVTGSVMLSGDQGLGSTTASAASKAELKEFIGRDKSVWGRPLFAKKHRHWRRHKWGWQHKWDTSSPNQGIGKPDLGLGGTKPPNEGISKPVLGMPR